MRDCEKKKGGGEGGNQVLGQKIIALNTPAFLSSAFIAPVPVTRIILPGLLPETSFFPRGRCVKPVMVYSINFAAPYIFTGSRSFR